jgi:hypothetical protein
MGRILNSHPDNQPSGPTFKQSFADAYVMFTHFGKAADDWCISDTFAFMALCRNMAISCQERMKFTDLCIPIHFGWETALSRYSTSAIFISIKDKEKVMGYNHTHINVNKMKFFTSVDKNQPVINLVLQLSVQADGQYMSIMCMKAQLTPGLFVTPERRGRSGQEVPVTPIGISVLCPLNTDEPKTQAKIQFLDLPIIQSMQEAAILSFMELCIPRKNLCCMTFSPPEISCQSMAGRTQGTSVQYWHRSPFGHMDRSVVVGQTYMIVLHRFYKRRQRNAKQCSLVRI